MVGRKYLFHANMQVSMIRKKRNKIALGGLDKTLCMYDEKYSHYIFGNRDSDRCVHVRLSLLQGMGGRTEGQGGIC